MSKEQDFIDALQEISHARGPFKQDQMEHAYSTIQAMQETAMEALRKYGIEPEGKPVE